MHNNKDKVKSVITHPLLVYPLTALVAIFGVASILFYIILRTAKALLPLIAIIFIAWLVLGNKAHAAEVSSNMHVGATIAPYDHITISPGAQVSQQTNDKVQPVIKKQTINQDGQEVTIITIYS